MDKEKLCELLSLLQELIIEAIKNPTSNNVEFLVNASMFMRSIERYLR